eukprot:364281-Chlamydomonas_euryale.AAC.5
MRGELADGMARSDAVADENARLREQNRQLAAAQAASGAKQLDAQMSQVRRMRMTRAGLAACAARGRVAPPGTGGGRARPAVQDAVRVAGARMRAGGPPCERLGRAVLGAVGGARAGGPARRVADQGRSRHAAGEAARGGGVRNAGRGAAVGAELPRAEALLPGLSYCAMRERFQGLFVGRTRGTDAVPGSPL